MSDVTMITPAQERALSGALVSAIQNVNSGMTPNESLAKSANDHGLTPEFACRMVEAYNASKTVKYLQSTEGEKRAENFDLADRDQVLKLMYTPEEKSARVNLAHVMVGAGAVAAGGAVAMDQLKKKQEKAALKEEKEKEKTASTKPGPALRENKAVKLASLCSQLKQAGDELRMELRHAKDQIVKAACALESALRVPGHESFEELERRVISTYGAHGKKAMDIVWGMSDFERLGEKRASAPDRLLVMGAGLTYDCARDLMSWLDKAARVSRDISNFEEQTKKVKMQKVLPESSGQQPGGTGATFVSDPGMPRRPATAPMVDSEKVAEDDEGEFTFDPVKAVSQITKKPEISSMFDPAQEGKLRAIKTKLMVNDMISNDPVLSAYPPEAVLNSYNELSRMAPGLSGQPILMRSLVGRALQTGGRLEANEIGQLLDAEQTHREIRVRGY